MGSKFGIADQVLIVLLVPELEQADLFVDFDRVGSIPSSRAISRKCCNSSRKKGPRRT
jgi:hypothetical protein